MKNNKGFAPVLVLLIALGIAVIGGGAYYTGTKNNFAQQNAQENNNTSQLNCNKNDKPWVKIISPNGGESFKVGEQISVKWDSCNIPADSDMYAWLWFQKGDMNYDGGETNIGKNNGGGNLLIPEKITQNSRSHSQTSIVSFASVGEAYLTLTPKPLVQNGFSNNGISYAGDTTKTTFSIISPSTITAGLKIYSNSQYGFEFKYPNSYLLAERNSGMQVGINPGVRVESSLFCKTIKEGGVWPKDCFLYNLSIQKNKITAEGIGIIKTTIQFAGYSAEKIQFPDSEGMYGQSSQVLIQFKRGDNWYINNFYFNSENKVASEKSMGQILSTFKFIDLEDITQNNIVEQTLIEKGYYGGYGQKENLIINDSEQWRTVWNKIYSRQSSIPKLPNINFSNKTVLAIFAGQKSSGGYSVDISKIEESSLQILVYVQLSYPGKNCVVTTSITQPFYIVSIPKTTKPISFIVTDKEINCN